MKKILSIALIATLFASCKKDAGSIPAPTPAPSKKLIRLESVEYPNSTIDFGYDSLGRLVTTESAEVKTTLEFKGATADYTSFLKTENRNYAAGTFTLDATGRATSYDVTWHPTANTTRHYQYTYTYDAQGHLASSVVNYNPGTASILFEFQNGNLYKETYTTNNAMNSYWVYTYSSDLDKTGVNNLFTIYTNQLGGIANLNLWTKAEQYSPANVKQVESVCTNVLDADGYVTKRTNHYSNNAEEHYNYIYK